MPGAPVSATRTLLLNRWTISGVTTFMVVDAVREVAAGSVVGASASWLMLVYHNAAWWLPWYLIVPVIGAASDRWSVLGPRRAVAAAVHVLLALGATLGHVVAVSFLMSLMPVAPDRWPGMVPTAVRLLLTYGMLDLMTYVAAAAIWHAVTWSREMTRRAEEARVLVQRTSELEHELTGATLDALRAQLNPHFLFNALNAVSGLVRSGDRDRAVSAIAQLGDLLRETLAGEGAQEVPLAEEVALVRRYLAIEEIRLASRLRIVVTVPDEAEQCPVPSLLLQPLVENAIRHGIARWSEGGDLTISARQDARHLTIAVQDVPRVPRVGPPQGVTREGIGLGNTRRRLERLYGSRASLRITFADDGGCVAEVALPLGGAGR